MTEEALSTFKIETEDDFQVEYEILPAYGTDEVDPRKKEINKNIADIDAMSVKLNKKIDYLNKDIDRLTNHADGLDYALAVTSGVIAGIIDIVFVGEWDFKKAKDKSNKEINEKIMNFAKKNGYEGNKLNGAVSFLEKKFPLPGDGAYKEIINPITGKADKITNFSHHLDDFCHHPTLIGLICCIIVQFQGNTIYFDKNGEHFKLPIEVNEYGQFQGHNPITKLFSGVINWFLNCAKAMANAKGHWMSDLAGSKNSAGEGMGLPGSFMSLMKELSSIPIFKDSGFSKNLDKAFRNGIGEGKKQVDLGAFNALFEGEGVSSQFDYRTENAIKGELKRQALPVIINEVLVRGVYFIRRFIVELKEHNSLMDINWKNVIPFRNRTIVRMMTISTGTFTAIDLADAAIEAAIKNAGNVENPRFLKDFILRVNFVGIGRFAIAVGTDIGMGVKKQHLIKERMQYKAEDGMLQTGKLFYMQEGMWIEAVDTEKAIQELTETTEKTMLYYIESCDDISESIENIGNTAIEAEKKNPGLINEMKDILSWG